ncbi:restriction endonuclease subunit S [Cyanobium sp. FGCU-6]|nr:restriction endonuclease subunit S [Cyanobium sp. FGCU6]
MKVGKVALGELARVRTGKLDANASSPNGKYPFFTCAINPLRIDTFSYECECVLVAGNGDLNVKYHNGRFDAYQRTYIVEPISESLDCRYLYHFLDSYLIELRKLSIGGVIRYIKLGNLTEAQIPLPPLEEQRRIAAILDKRHSLEEKIKRRGLLQEDLWKAEFVKRFGNPFAHQSPYPLWKLGEIASTSSGGTPRREVGAFFGGSIPWVKSGELSNPLVESTEEFLTEEGLDSSSAKILNPGVVLLAMYGATAGAVSILGIQASTNQAICAIDAHDRLDSIYLADYLRLITPALLAKRIGGAQPNLTQEIIRNILIPVPGEDSQRFYVSFRKQMANVETCFSSSLFAISRLGASFSQHALELGSGLQ